MGHVHRGANQGYLEDGVQLLELARRAHELFLNQPPREKRRLLNFVLSNCTWKDGQLSATYRQPFDLLAVSATADRDRKTADVAADGLSAHWLPGPDSNQRPIG